MLSMKIEYLFDNSTQIRVVTTCFNKQSIEKIYIKL